MPFERQTLRRDELVDGRAKEQGRIRRQASRIALQHRAEPIRPASLPRPRRSMQVDDRIGDLLEQGRRERPTLRNVRQKRFVCKPPHLEQPIDGVALAVEAEAAALARDAVDGEVDLRRGSAIKVEFALERFAATLRRGEVQVAIPHGALEFPRAAVRQEDVCGMRVDPLTRTSSERRIAREIGQHVERSGWRVGRRAPSHEFLRKNGFSKMQVHEQTPTSGASSALSGFHEACRDCTLMPDQQSLGEVRERAASLRSGKIGPFPELDRPLVRCERCRARDAAEPAAVPRATAHRVERLTTQPFDRSG